MFYLYRFSLIHSVQIETVPLLLFQDFWYKSRNGGEGTGGGPDPSWKESLPLILPCLWFVFGEGEADGFALHAQEGVPDQILDFILVGENTNSAPFLKRVPAGFKENTPRGLRRTEHGCGRCTFLCVKYTAWWVRDPILQGICIT